MPTMTSFDLPAAHRHFAPNCFNQTWELLDQPTRTEEEDRELLARAWASLYHWRQRPDVGPRELSVGYWLLSRVYAVLRQGAEARRYATISLGYADELPPFYRGYAYEGLARAALVLDDRTARQTALQAANACLSEVTNQDEHTLLEADLRTLE